MYALQSRRKIIIPTWNTVLSETVAKLHRIKEHTQTPSLNGTLCSMMALHNPLDLYWLPVSCHDKHLDEATLYCMDKSTDYYNMYHSNNKFKQSHKQPTRTRNKDKKPTFITSTNIFNCTDGTQISSVLVLDGIKHCTYEEDEFQCDEYFPVEMCLSEAFDVQKYYVPRENMSLIIKDRKQPCITRMYSEIQNVQNGPKVHDASFCIYKEDTCHHMVPYWDGRHLTSCSNHTCERRYFKCPGFYCVPWRYVCNKSWQCPGGQDEINCTRTSCPGQFKCKNSAVCLSFDTICDGSNDCPENDDEILCSPKISVCPDKCSCVVYAINCVNITSLFPKQQQSHPYIYVGIQESPLIRLHELLQQINRGHSFYIIKNEAKQLCSVLNSYGFKTKIIRLQFSHNGVEKLGKGCFADMTHLKYLNLSHNSIKAIRYSIFQGHKRLSINLLDFSHNHMAFIYDKALEGINEINTIYVLGNDFREIGMEIFNDINIMAIIGDNYKICCIKPSILTNCTELPTWPNTCERLIGDKMIGLCMWLIGGSALILNITICIIYLFGRDIISKESSFVVMILNLAVGDAFVCAPLMI